MKSPTLIDLHIGKQLHRRRKILQLTQERLGALIGVRGQTIARFEVAENKLSAYKLFILAQALGVSVEYFFYGLDKAQTLPLDRKSPDAITS